MAFKLVFLCASAFLVQTITAQYINQNQGWSNSNQGWSNCNQGWSNSNQGWSNPGASCGIGVSSSNIVSALSTSTSIDSFPVTSTSALSPIPVTILSENVIQGPLAVTGNLPVLAAVSFESSLPTSGAVGTSYSCGDQNVGITSESLSSAGLGGSSNSAAISSGYSNNLAGSGLFLSNYGAAPITASGCGIPITSGPNFSIPSGPSCGVSASIPQSGCGWGY